MEDKPTISPTLSYEQFWGNSERKDLLPPQKIEIEHIGNKANIPFSVDLNQEGLTEILKVEGVRNGRPLSIKLKYERDLLGTPESTRMEDTLAKAKSLAFELVGTGGLVLGQAGEYDGGYRIILNLGRMYDVALATSIKSKDQVQPAFTKLAAKFTAHEVGHLRQPKGFRGNLKASLAIKSGSFLVIHTLRRLHQPWLGGDEPGAVLLEAAGAEAISEVAYISSSQERFAREYQRSSQGQWEKLLQINLSSPDQLTKDYFWGHAKDKVHEVARILKEGKR